MFSKRSLVVFAAAFALVLISGAALAQVGSLPLGSDGGEVTDIFAGDFDQDPQEESATPPDEGEGDEKEQEQEPVKKEEPAEPRQEEKAEEPHQEEKAEEPHQEEKAEEPHEEEKAEEKSEEAPAALGIEILHPSPNAHVDNKVQVFEGWVTPEVGARVNRGKYEAHTSGDGWRIELVLSAGKNVVTMVAHDEFGREAKDIVTVWYDAPHEEEPKEAAFSANQKYGSCGEDVPYDVFFGTAVPNSTVWVESRFGGGSTKAGENGGWDLKVKFPEAPPGEVFEVVVEGEGGRKVFTFVNTGGGEGGGDH